MKVWITKYALTKGIEEKEAVECPGFEGMIRVNGCSVFASNYHGEGDEWHRNHDLALKQAEEMRQKKIASLKKQIEKLEKLRFE